MSSRISIWNSPPSFLTCSMSPAWTSREGLANCPLDWILPRSQARDARERVLKKRAAQSHLSIRTEVMALFSYEVRNNGMLTDELPDRVCVVLVRARNPNNIGAVARAMYGFGFDDLRLVSEYPVALEEARSAVDAAEILSDAREFGDVADAIADCNLVVGTTAAGKRVLEHPLYTAAEGGGLARAHLAEEKGNRAALLFGSEKTGLSREELSYCNWTMTVPMADKPDVRHPSMNLGQAAAVCLYELIRDEAAGPRIEA